jgi:hypothetical protein
MKKRNIFAVLLLPFVTFGIYGIVWWVKTKNEMNQQGAKIPTAWLLIVPVVSIYWIYAYSKGVEQVTGGKISTGIAFLVEIFLGSIGNAIIQNSFNTLADAPAAPVDNSMVNPIQPASDPIMMASAVQPDPIVDMNAPTTMSQTASPAFGAANEAALQSDFTTPSMASVDQPVVGVAPAFDSNPQTESVATAPTPLQPVDQAPVEPALDISGTVPQPTVLDSNSSNTNPNPNPINPTTV